MCNPGGFSCFVIFFKKEACVVVFVLKFRILSQGGFFAQTLLPVVQFRIIYFLLTAKNSSF